MVFPRDFTSNSNVNGDVVAFGFNSGVGIFPPVNPELWGDYWKAFSDTEGYWQADPCDTCMIRLTLPTVVTLDDIQIVSNFPATAIYAVLVEVRDFADGVLITPGSGLSIKARKFHFHFAPAQGILQVTSITASFSGSTASGYVVPLAESGALPPAPSRPTSGLVYPRSR
jgi:hypothetical protein